ncbi:MAG: imidazole glycerol phosphate synthase subunit HisF [Candidatus Rokubacteria bacterium]|nr:imidazole glycerol phosphate synthase subunit HisF [Candidatus Rokubacteria bacterium]
MLKSRLIPSLLLLNGRCVKTIGFDALRDVGNPVTAARVYDAQEADELIFLDISATTENRTTLYHIVERTADACLMPLTVGGGVRTLEDIRDLLRSGADKVAINTEAVRRPEVIRDGAERFGAQCIVASIDCRRLADGRYEVFVQRGQRPTGLDPVVWAERVAELGAGEIFLNSIDRDGTMQGYDLALIRAVADAVPIPVIAAGGAGSLRDLVDAITLGRASAVSAASLFHFTDQSVIKARAYMRQAGVDVRIA